MKAVVSGAKPGGKNRRAAYVLVLRNPARRRVRVGGLGLLEFPPGFYLYVGSGGLNAVRRVQRHLAPDKPVRWHADYLTTGPRRMWPVDAFILPGRAECELARRLGGRLDAVPGFGSSDCRCAGHLYHAPDGRGLERALAGLATQAADSG
ncbi:MAG: GIY-YIG nuclease family protein [bacterium]